MTSLEICQAAESIKPNIQLRSVTSTLRGFEKRGLVYCLFPHRVKGRLYFFTDMGRAIAKQTLGKIVEPLSKDIDMDAYSKISYAKIRRIVLLELVKKNGKDEGGKTVVEIKRNLLDSYPIGVNQTLKAVKELEGYGLAESLVMARKGNRKLYKITSKGEKIVEQLKK